MFAHATPSPQASAGPAPPPGPALAVTLLGAFQATFDDQPLQGWPGRLSRGLFRYLIAHREQPIPRLTLMAQFWPDADPSAARNCLNVALHTVRSVLRAVTSAPVLLFEDDAYHFSPAITVWVDAEEFSARLAEAQRLERDGRLYAALAEYGQAVSLYRGEFMADEPYLDWPIMERVRLRMQYLDALDRLSRQYLEHDRTAECIQLCHLMLRHDNCHEEAHHRLMQCYARQGQRHLAVQQYHICVATLRAELSVSPGDAITRLYRVLRQQLAT